MVEDSVDVNRERPEIEDRRELGLGQQPSDPRVSRGQRLQLPLVVPRRRRKRLDGPVRVVARQAGGDERQQKALAEEDALARVEVSAHLLGAHHEAVDQPGEAVEHRVEGVERVGNDHAFGRGVGDVTLVPKRDVL